MKYKGGAEVRETITPDSGYYAMNVVRLYYEKAALFNAVHISSSDSVISFDSGVYVKVYSYVAPDNDNSTTDLQRIEEIAISENGNGNVIGFGVIYVRAKIQYITIESNGTYYPTDDNTVIKKIVVNVPTTTIRNYNYGTIESNGQYSIPSGYTGISSFTVEIKNIINYVKLTGTISNTYTINSFSGMSGNPGPITVGPGYLLILILIYNKNETKIRIMYNGSGSSRGYSIDGGLIFGRYRIFTGVTNENIEFLKSNNENIFNVVVGNTYSPAYYEIPITLPYNALSY